MHARTRRSGPAGAPARGRRPAYATAVGRLLAVLLAATGCSLRGPPPDASGTAGDRAWAELVAAEDAFAARAEAGVSSAFLEVLAEDGVVFAPGPVSGREEHRDRPFPRESYLRWHPRTAGVSRAGDLGYTAGPWVAGTGSAPPRSAGHYLSVWRRTAAGRWELLVDGGVTHPPLEDQAVRRAASRYPAEPASADAPVWTREEAEETLARRQALLHMVLAVDAAVPLPSLVIPDARVYAEGLPPGRGMAALASAMSSGRIWTVAGSGMARSLDLAYAWGTIATPGVPGSGRFLEIWSLHQGEWDLAVALFAGP